MAFEETRNMPFSLVLQKLSSFEASSEVFNIVLFMVFYILIAVYSIVIYEPIEFQIPASACSSILHISHSFQKQKKRTKHYCTRQIEYDSNCAWQMTFIIFHKSQNYS